MNSKDLKHWSAIAGLALAVGIYELATAEPQQPRRQPVASKPAAPITGPSDFTRKLRAMSEVRKALRDPDSATFGEMYVSKRSGVPIVCGYVNARNGFGGMTGQQRFVSGAVTALEEQVRQGDMDEVWSKTC